MGGSISLRDDSFISSSISSPKVDINNKEGLIISGFDVEQLYPSLRDVDVACLVRESLIHSKIDFEGFDYQKAMCYLRIVAGEEILRFSGLSKLIPKWSGDRVETLKVSGLSGRNMDNWIHSPHIPTIF